MIEKSKERYLGGVRKCTVNGRILRTRLVRISLRITRQAYKVIEKTFAARSIISQSTKEQGCYVTTPQGAGEATVEALYSVLVNLLQERCCKAEKSAGKMY